MLMGSLTVALQVDGVVTVSNPGRSAPGRIPGIGRGTGEELNRKGGAGHPSNSRRASSTLPPTLTVLENSEVFPSGSVAVALR